MNDKERISLDIAVDSHKMFVVQNLKNNFTRYISKKLFKELYTILCNNLIG